MSNSLQVGGCIAAVFISLLVSLNGCGGDRPLGPLGFEGAQHRQTFALPVIGIRSKALRPFGVR